VHGGGTTREGGEVAALLQPGDVTSSKVQPDDGGLRSGPRPSTSCSSRPAVSSPP
jgi:hypothetical protein